MARGDREFAGVIGITTPSVVIPVMRHSMSPGIQQQIESNSGDVDPTYVSTMLVAARMTATTRQMSTLSSFGISGAAVATVDMWFQQKVENGLRNATSKKLTMLQGMGVPRTVSLIGNLIPRDRASVARG